MEIKVKLDNFEGPFDLLLHLIDQRKMDPLKLVVSKIIDNYLSFLQEAKMEDLDIKVDFLVMASELLEIKALSVLNLSEKEKKEEELGQRIHEYKIFKGISRQLELFENEYNISYHKGKKGKNIVNRPNKEIDLSKLGIEDIFNAYLSQIRETEEVLDINLNQTYNLSQEIENLNQNLKKHGKAEINDILKKAQNRMHIVYLFLAILEMYRNNLVKIDGKTIWLS